MRQKKARNDCRSPLPLAIKTNPSFPLAPLATAGSPATTRYRYFGRQSETRATPLHAVVNVNILGLSNELFIHQHREPIDVENLIRVFRFIQNHGQLRPGSPAHVEINPNWRDLLALEILLQNLVRFLRNINH